MIVKNYKGKPKKLVKFLTEDCNDLSYATVMKVLRKKDIKVNDKRVKENVDLCDGDEIKIYVPDELLKSEKPLAVVYEDDNIIIINKPDGIEVVGDEEDLLSIVSNYCGKTAYACHRLDRNTTGLVIFAKTEEAYKIMFEAFKKRTIKKYYKALVFGKPKQSDKLIAYLKKDEKKSEVYISDKKQPGYVKIETHYKLIESNTETSLLEVELVTGKTHQIRAHLAHIGCPIVGDGKYGNNDLNRKFGKKRQELNAYKIQFKFDKNSKLSYLNEKVIML